MPAAPMRLRPALIHTGARSSRLRRRPRTEDEHKSASMLLCNRQPALVKVLGGKAVEGSKQLQQRGKLGGKGAGRDAMGQLG